jgi:hypothetical protein
MQRQSQYLVVHQTRDREPTDYENLLADGIEQAYARGIQELPQLVAALNEGCIPSPGGKPWTEELFVAEMKRLGA